MLSLKRLRKNKKLTQKDLAKIMGVTPITISMWETGRSRPTSKHFNRLCKVFEVRPETIFRDRDQYRIYLKEWRDRKMPKKFRAQSTKITEDLTKFFQSLK
jgi:transcriptional regulator with XRE-family HTH domain